MPPKRKAAGGAKAGGKKAKAAEEPAAPATMKDASAVLKAADKKTGAKKSHKVDQFCNLFNAQVVDDYDCMLNQTNIGHNNNKYYVIQVLQSGANYYSWNRWGRVGEPGANALKGPTNLAAAVKEFEKKFSDKTKNKWANRASFTPAPGKYTLLEMADEEDEVDAPPALLKSPSLEGKKIAKCTLDKETQGLIKLIFDNDMFKDTLKKYDIDVKKMPLGKLSKGQIAKGFDVLDDIEKELNANRTTKLNDLSSKFYTVIPHDFGRKIPPAIRDLEALRQKMDMLLVLGDIEIAMSMEKAVDQKYAANKSAEVPHPFDNNYGMLNCKLELVSQKSEEFKVIKTYTDQTAGSWRKPTIKQVWKVNRDGESSRFKVHDKMGNRKLLWHGTNVAVVAAILKSGLRIMPHSGGRVGAGIYFASENAKSAGYVGTVDKTGIMFLNEVALGKSQIVKQNQSHLKAAPPGYDSVLAIGWTEPDPKADTTLKFDGKEVVVPQGKPKNNPGGLGSDFSQSEYLVYKESQNRIRYLLLMDF